MTDRPRAAAAPARGGSRRPRRRARAAATPRPAARSSSGSAWRRSRPSWRSCSAASRPCRSRRGEPFLGGDGRDRRPDDRLGRPPDAASAADGACRERPRRHGDPVSGNRSARSVVLSPDPEPPPAHAGRASRPWQPAAGRPPPHREEPDDEDPGVRRPGRRQRRARDRRQAPRGPAGARRAPVPRPPADRGRPGDRQDRPRQGDRPQPRLLVPADPVHAGPAAVGRHRPLDLQPEDPGVRVPAGPDHDPGRPRRRDQPGDAEDPVGPARVHGGAPGDDRRHHPPDARPVPRHRHPEPDRVRGHVRPARGAARPLHAPPAAGLPAADRGDRHPRRAEARPPARRPRGGLLGRRAARAAGRRPRDLRRRQRVGVHRPPRQRHPDAPRRLPRRVAARLHRAVPGRPGPRGPARAATT